MTGWVSIGSDRFARLPGDLRNTLLARAWVNLIFLSFALASAGPGTAGALYAARCRVVRVGPDGDVQVWSGP